MLFSHWLTAQSTMEWIDNRLHFALLKPCNYLNVKKHVKHGSKSGRHRQYWVHVQSWLLWNSTSNFTDFTLGAVGLTQLKTLHSFSHVDTCGEPTIVTCWVPLKPGSMSKWPLNSFDTLLPMAASSASTNRSSFAVMTSLFFHDLFFYSWLKHASCCANTETMVHEATSETTVRHQSGDCLTQTVDSYWLVYIPARWCSMRFHHGVLVQSVTLWFSGQ